VCLPLSVLLSTRNRADILRRTLVCLCRQEISSKWELIVVDNDSHDDTPMVLSDIAERLPLVRLCEPQPGKSGSLNRALSHARGKLIVFTDDDVRPDPNWLIELERAFLEHNDARVFCGPIIPLFPENTPKWLSDTPFAGPAFAQFNPSLPEGYLPQPLLPFGPNFAVTADALGAMRFRPDLGAGFEQNIFMGEDTELLMRLRSSERFVFVPTASVGHYIRPEQLALPWLFERAFVHGRSMIHIGKKPTSFMPELRTDEFEASRRVEAQRFHVGALLNYFYGQIYQLSRTGQATDMLERTVTSLPWFGDREMLSRSALEWLSTNRSHLPRKARAGFCADARSS